MTVSSGFSVVANSLLAYASVNHLHYHILYVQEQVLAASVVSEQVMGTHLGLPLSPSLPLNIVQKGREIL